MQPEITCALCQKCGLHRNSKHPFLAPIGADAPAITFVLESPSENDDFAGRLGEKGALGFLKVQVEEQAQLCGFDTSTIRWTTMTRCLPVSVKGWKAKANICRTFLVKDFQEHKPQLIVPVGSPVLGFLSHKSNAADWAGRTLTYRGWPDDWIMDSKMMRNGHPVLGEKPMEATPMIPIQASRLVWATHSRKEIEAWKTQLREILEKSRQSVPLQNFNYPWYKIVEEPQQVLEGLQELIDRPGTPVSFDTETNSLRPYATESAIVFMMFRWCDERGNPKSIGFPWDYPESPLKSHLDILTPVILKALYQSKLQGHNLTFDILFAHAKLKGNLEALTKAMSNDTMHMIYTLNQRRMSLGLESITYDWCPELAGYEEEMVLLIKREGDLLDPKNRKGGHYAKCPKPLWESHLKPYVMGDVEAVHRIAPAVQSKLNETVRYKIPLSHPTKDGFRYYSPPNQAWAYENIMRPSAQVLTRLMGRGMHVDEKELTALELYYPAKVMELRNNLRNVDERIITWCEKNEAQDPEWELDLENQEQLKTVLYDLLKLPVTNLTEGGDKLAAGKLLSDEERMKFASTDKYTLHKMAVTHPQIRPLQEYKSLFKEFGTFIRPVRKCLSGQNLIDKKFLKKMHKKDPHLCPDGMIHCSFNLSSTRSGRLSASNPNLQQLKRDGKVKRMFNSRFEEQGCLLNADLCLAHGQRVWTRTGLLKIEDVKIGDEVEQEDGSFRRVTNTMARGIQPVVKLITSGGYQFTATRNHRIRVIDFNGKYVWKRIEEISEADYVVIQPRKGENTEPYKLLEAPIKTHPNQKPIKIPEVATPDFCFFWGFLLGNGCISSNYCSYLVCDTDVDVANRLEAIVRSVFGLRVGESRYRGAIAHVISSALLCRWALKFGYDKLKVPDFVYSLDRECLAAFLMGLFESDGSAGVSSSQIRSNGQRISFCSCKPEFAKGVQFLLLSLGIHSGLRFLANDKQGGWRVEIRADSVADFISTVGFASVRKKKCATAYADRVGFGKKFGLPNQQVTLSSMILHKEAYRVTNNIRSRNSMVTVPVAKAIVMECKDSELVRRCKRFLKSGQRFEKVKAIQECGEMRTCDIEVEGTETFVANGFVSHNSQIELRLIAAACGDANLVNAYRNGLDLHSQTASLIYQIPIDKFGDEYLKFLAKEGRTEEIKKLKEYRSTGKTVNFLTGYGGGALGLQFALSGIGIYKTEEECNTILEHFFNSYPQLKEYLGVYKIFILDNGVAVSLLGRVREFPDAFSSDSQLQSKALRAGCNHLIQSTSSDMMLVLLRVVENLMRDEGMESILVSTVHDSMVLDCVRDELSRVYSLVTFILNNIPDVFEALFGNSFDLSWMRMVPLTGDCEVGLNYGELVGVPENPDWDKLLSI